MDILSPNQALAIVDNCPIPVLVLDKRGCLVSYNRAFEQLVGSAEAGKLRQRDIGTLETHPAYRLFSNDESAHWTDRSDVQHHFRIVRASLPDPEYAEVRFLVNIDTQVELEQAHQRLNSELEQHKLTDSITGLLNQRGIMLALEPQVARSRRYNSPMSVIMLDVQTNGDRNSVLTTVTRLLKDQLRWADLIGCTDQHEFILVLPETASAAAFKLADKLKQRLLGLANISPEQAICSFYGVTEWLKTDNATTLLSRAAVALTQARSQQNDHCVAL